MSKEITLKAGTSGKTGEFAIAIPVSIEDYLDKGFTTEAIESMLEMDLRRKLAVVIRDDMKSEHPSEDLSSTLNSYIYVPGRKSGSSKVSKARSAGQKEGKTQAVNVFSQLLKTLSKKEIGTFSSLPEDYQLAILRLESVSDMVEAVKRV